MTDETLLTLVRMHDPDRFLAGLFAPPAHRDTLLALIAFNHELARAREVASEPTLALIRLQWWREVAEGGRRRHEVAAPLGAALDDGRLNAADLLDMIAGREAEADPVIADVAAWQAWLGGTAGALAVAAGRALGGAGDALERLRRLGTAYGVGGQVRSVAALARQGRCLLPADLLAAHGLSVHDVIARPDTPALRPVLAALADWGRALLAEAGGPVPRPLLAAALPAVLARRDLRQAGIAARPRGLGDRLAVVAAAAIGRV